MSLILVKCSIVLTTRNYLPPVNHEFLENKKIIPENFEKKGNSISTPVFSQINYTNGFNITTEPDRTIFQFSGSNIIEQEKNLNLLKDISSKYVKIFEYIKYQAIGINFDFINEVKYDSIMEKIVKLESTHLSFENNKGTIHNIELSYSVKGKKFNVTIRRLEKKPAVEHSSQTAKPDFVPLFHINIHYPGEYADNKETIIEELPKNYNQAKQFIGMFQ